MSPAGQTGAVSGATPSYPEGWTLSRFGRELSINEGLVDPTEEPWASLRLIAPNHVERDTGRLLDSVTATEQGAISGKSLVTAGQIIYSKIRPSLNKVVIAPEDCLCSADMYAVTCQSTADARYAHYQMLAKPFHSYVTATSDRVKMPKVNREELNAAPWLVPRPDQQSAIADFLDRETVQIDTLIATQQQLVEKLRERRASLLAHAASGGYSAATRRSADLGWAATVPEHWDVVNIRLVAAMKTGHTPSRSVDAYWEDVHIPWFTLADVWQLRDGREVYLGDTASRISDLGLENSSAELLPAGTVVLSRTASVGFAGIMPQPMATSQDFWNWVCGPRLDPRYLLWLLRAMRPHLLSLMIGSTHQTIYQPIAAALRVPLPPLAEQKCIVQQLEREIATIDTLIDKAGQFVRVARERRSALITAAVTGQITVPGGDT